MISLQEMADIVINECVLFYFLMMHSYLMVADYKMIFWPEQPKYHYRGMAWLPSQKPHRPQDLRNTKIKN